MAEAPANPLVIGRIAAVYGVKGWVKLYSFTEPMENALQYRHCFLKRGGQWQAVEIDQGRPHGKGLVVHLAGVDDREQARALTGCELAVPVEELPALEEGEYYWHQLEGLAVVTGAPGGGDLLLGRVDHLMDTGANDVLVVRPCEGSIDRRERLIPYVPGQFVLEVDTDAGRIWVDWDPEF